MPITIRDVAEAASTSLSTVSRAFSKPDSVSRATRERVLAAADELGYRPNELARSLRGGATGTIGLVIPDLVNPFFPPIVKAIQLRERRAGRTVLTADGGERADEEHEAIEALISRVDGLILWAPVLDDGEIRRYAEQVPVVLVNRDVESVASIHVDLSAGLRQAAEHLRAYGHRTCAYVTCAQPGSRRGAEALEAIASAGIDGIELGPYAPVFETGLHAAPLVLAQGATAVIAHNDLVALGLLQQFAALGVSVPGDVSVVGIDDTILAATATPGLSTVRIDPEAIAASATDRLHAVISGTDAEAPAVGTRFVPRASSGRARALPRP